MHRLLLFILIFYSQPGFANSFDHSTWDNLLKKHVYSSNNGMSTFVDYQGMKTDKMLLKNYLTQLGQIDKPQFDSWPYSDQLAFLINAYNAWTIELIIRTYPRISSIKDLGGFLSPPWKKKFILLFEDTLSLDDIEHSLIRGSSRYREPRIHFAVNCASIGCPALRNEAYTGNLISAQLEEQTQKFLSDKSRNHFEENAFRVSPIFKWYKKDFEQGWRGAKSLESFFLLYADTLSLTQNTRLKLKNSDIHIEYSNYDWRLNARNK